MDLTEARELKSSKAASYLSLLCDNEPPEHFLIFSNVSTMVVLKEPGLESVTHPSNGE